MPSPETKEKRKKTLEILRSLREDSPFDSNRILEKERRRKKKKKKKSLFDNPDGVFKELDNDKLSKTRPGNDVTGDY